MAAFSTSQLTSNPNLLPPSAPLLLHSTFRNRENCLWKKKRRLKLKRKFKKLSHVQNSLEPSSTSFDLLSLLPPAALGFASALALSIPNFMNRNDNNNNNSSRLKSDSNYRVSDIGEWILFSSPTPFNRFVFLRCPSISFEEYLEDVSEKLVNEEKHFVRLDGGRIQVNSDDKVDAEERESVEYQRVCVRADDGGVISLDWPANLDLREERGLDTTVVLVPGTPKGSLDDNVRSFAKECLRQGLFPVVMNPRGCAGSPLTTARLFTAADSDDICSAIQFITKARPWSSLTGVGWGYGANMLTKYLAEAGDKTPLTAATCFDNPFDLDEATRTSPYCTTIDDKLTRGLIDILKSNKELFQGRRKGFDVEKALASESVRDFEKAISMVSHGFDTIEEFYSNSSTRSLVGHLKVPVLFVQNDNGTVPLFSIPRGSIAENLFTSLLLCSCLPSKVNAISWYQQVAIEWLTAVELGYLKGRHPLLQDIDVTINPSRKLALVEGRTSDTSERLENIFNIAKLDSSDAYVDPMKEMLTETDALSGIDLEFNHNSPRNQAPDDHVLSKKNDPSSHSSSKDEDSTEDFETSPEESDSGQVLQTAQVVMNMLDVTMPGTLQEEEKKKVLSAVGQGETLLKALQDAVPEDVRGKLTTSASEILQTQGKNMNLDTLLSIKRRLNASSGLKSKNKENATLHSNSNNGIVERSSDSSVPGDARTGSSDIDQVDGDKLLEATGSQLPKTSTRSDVPESKTVDLNNDDTGLTKGLNDSQNNDEKLNNDASAEKKVGPVSDVGTDLSEAAAKVNSSNSTAGGTNSEAGVMQSNRSQDDETNKKESNVSEIVGEPKDLSDEQNNTRSASDTRPADKSDAPAEKKVGQVSDLVTGLSETAAKVNSTNSTTGGPNSEAGVTLSNRSQNDETNKKESNVSEIVGEPKDLSDEQNNTRSAADNNEATAPISENQQSENGDDSKTMGETAQPLPDQNRASDSKNPTFSVSQAFDAFIGLDDSTQVAVNSVFGALEDIIAQLEEKNSKSTVNEETENKDLNGSIVEKDSNSSELQPEKQADGEDKEDTVPLDMELVKTHDSNSNIIDSPTAAADKGTDIGRLNLIINKPTAAYAEGMEDISKNSCYLTSDPYFKELYKEFLRKYILLKIQKAKLVDMDLTTTPLLNNVLEDGQWLMLKQPADIHVAVFDNSKDKKEHSELRLKENDMDNVIEPSYVIIDKERQEGPVEELLEKSHGKLVNHDSNLDRSKLFVKTALLNSLKVEVNRRHNASDMEDVEPGLAADMESVADAVYLAIQHNVELNQKILFSGLHPDFQEWSRLNGNLIIEAISGAVQNTSYLKKVLPIGVVVGSTLAALRSCFDLADVYCNSATEALVMDRDHINVSKSEDQLPQEVIIQLPINGINHDSTVEKKVRKDEGSIASNAPDEDDRDQAKSVNLNRDTLMVGAFTAAFGASALLTSNQEGFMGDDSCEISEENQLKIESVKSEEIVDNKNQSNVVTSLAKKAMSVAAPVVPTKEDGALDHDRLVTMLSELGQKGGMLRLAGKVALLWGGLRGAMSLTDRLISFLHIADRPLLHRILGFSCMVLVLWSPVLLPLLPTLFHNMATHNSSRIVELACVIGLYSAVTILIIQWGKRIRGYEYPLEHYGLDFSSSSKIQHFWIGLVGGIMLVLCIQLLNSFLGFVNLSFPPNLASSSLLSAKIKAYGQLFLWAGQGLLMAAGVAFVEELLFRSWLLEEIAADLGYHPGILLSGLAFALSQRSWQAIPGLWLFSLCLAGARLRKEGSLFIPIGLRTGLMASSYILQAGAFVVYVPKFPWWVIGSHPFQPFNGVVGLLFALLLAMAFYPRQLGLRERIPRTIRA